LSDLAAENHPVALSYPRDWATRLKPAAADEENPCDIWLVACGRLSIGLVAMKRKLREAD
jgi:hypothetical protein